MINEKDNKTSKLVFDMRVCRKLLQAGYRCIDIKPLKSDKNRTVLIFENTPKFQKAFEEITAEFKVKDEAKAGPEPVDFSF